MKNGQEFGPNEMGRETKREKAGPEEETGKWVVVGEEGRGKEGKRVGTKWGR